MRSILLAVVVAPGLFAQAPTIGAIVNGASFQPSLCPGVLASIFGSNLAAGTAQAASLPLATTLGGTKVLVQDSSTSPAIEAPLYFVSPGQINFQMPFETRGPNVSVTVATAQGVSKSAAVSLNPMAPGIFSRSADGAGSALAFDSNFQPLTVGPVSGPMILYVTGLGATAPAATTGAAGASAPPLNQVAGTFTVMLGGEMAKVSWAGLAPGFAGVYQVNVDPIGIPIGDISIQCATCKPSNHVRLPPVLTSSNNTANASGSVTIVYPSNETKLTYSPAAVVAKIALRFDVKADAGPFDVTVVPAISGGFVRATTLDNAVIHFDPAFGNFQAKMPSPPTAWRQGDFSQTGVRVIDFTTGLPMPGNIAPTHRIDTALLGALHDIPLPNTAPSGLHSLYTAVGAFTAGGTFRIDDVNHPDLTSFAVFVELPYPPGGVLVTVVLLIDGQVVDVATASF